MARAPLTRIYISVELQDGNVLEDLRVTVADQAAYSRSAKANRWPTDDNVKQQVFFAWASARRQGLTEATFEDWEKSVIDLDAASIPASEDQDPTEGSTS